MLACVVLLALQLLCHTDCSSQILSGVKGLRSVWHFVCWRSLVLIEFLFPMALRRVLDASYPAPTIYTDEELNRLHKRLNGYNEVIRSADYIRIVNEWPSHVPRGPDPYEYHTMPKRTWEKEMEVWRNTVKVTAAFWNTMLSRTL